MVAENTRSRKTGKVRKSAGQSKAGKHSNQATGEAYHKELYWWLHGVYWQWDARGLFGTADRGRCDQIFDENDADPARATREELEAIAAKIRALPDAWKRARRNNWPWRSSPPTSAELLKSVSGSLAAGGVLDAIEVFAGTPLLHAQRIVDAAEGYQRVRIRFAAGMSRAEVLAGLLDAVENVRARWEEIQAAGAWQQAVL